MRRAMLGRKEKDTGKGINGENAGKLEKQKQHYCALTWLLTIINKHQEFFLLLYQRKDWNN